MAAQIGRINGPALADNLSREGVGGATFNFETGTLVIDGPNNIINADAIIELESATAQRPAIRFGDTSQAADEKNWAIELWNDEFKILGLDDAWANPQIMFYASRGTGNTIASLDIGGDDVLSCTVGASGNLSLSGGGAQLNIDGAAAPDATSAGTDIVIVAGNGGATSGDAGDISLTPGTAAGSGSAGAVVIAQTAAPAVTTDKLYNVAGALTWNGTDLLNPAVDQLADADGDTQIQVEESADEDTIRIDVGDNVTGYPALANALVFSAGQFTLAFPAANVAATAGAPISITAGWGNTSGVGGDFDITAGRGGNIGPGGAVNITGGGGKGVGGSPGGAVNITGGSAESTAAGGAIVLLAGTGSATGTGGDVTITSGAGGATSGDAGDIILTAGTAAGSGADGNVVVTVGDIVVASGARLRLDGTAAGDSAIWEVSSNVVRILAGNSVSCDFRIEGPHLPGGILFTERADHSHTPAAGFGEIWVSNATGAPLMYTDDAGTDFILNHPAWKSYSATALTTGATYVGGFYRYAAADANLTIGGTVTQTFGTAGESHAAHAFCVASGAGGTDLVLTVTGVSIDDTGTRNDSDSEIIVADTDTATTNQYFETSKKWLGQITYTLTGTAGSFDFNYGFVKYDDFGNRDFTITDFDASGYAVAAESGLDIELLHHEPTAFVYNATAFVPNQTPLVSLGTDHGTNDDVGNTTNFAFKRAGMTTVVAGSGSEGIMIRLTTATNNSMAYVNFHLGANLS